MSQDAETLTIDVVSDVVCPWCYLGEKRLELALAGETDPVEIRWRPFQLDPAIPPGGLDRTEYMERKFGNSGRIAQTHDMLTRLGADAGISFAFDRINRAPNTLNAHRLVRWAASAGKQAEIVDRLFRAYFTEGLDIGDAAELTAIARECGLDPDAVATLLGRDDDKEAVRREIGEAQAIGVSGVPFFIFAGRLAVSGAQEVEVLRQAIAQARAMQAEPAG